jgi:hypothetical protein
MSTIGDDLSSERNRSSDLNRAVVFQHELVGTSPRDDAGYYVLSSIHRRKSLCPTSILATK